jgi:WD40 repeat protein
MPTASQKPLRRSLFTWPWIVSLLLFISVHTLIYRELLRSVRTRSDHHGGRVSEANDTHPRLRIETGQHRGLIWDMAPDPNGHFFATAGEDKTVRLWNAKDNTLLRTLHPPIGEVEMGSVYAVAVSPDGKTVACGGAMAGGNAPGEVVYLFDVKTGAVRHTLGSLPQSVTDLAFSPDGKYLAMAFAEGAGIQIYGVSYDSSDGTMFTPYLIHSDTSYNSEDACSVDFSEQNVLVTAADDGNLRLYQIPSFASDFRRQKMRFAPGVSASPTPGMLRPVNARFSPDGTRIAVGYEGGSSHIAIASAHTLEPMAQPNLSGGVLRGSGDFSQVAWSPDGKYVYGAGKFRAEIQPSHSLEGQPREVYGIRRWTPATGSFTDLSTGGNIVRRQEIVALCPLPKNALAFAAADGFLARVNTQGEFTLPLPSTAELWDQSGKHPLALTADGCAVRFSYTSSGSDTAVFSVSTSTLQVERPAAHPAGFLPPVRQAVNLRITGAPIPSVHENTFAVNGTPLGLSENETITSYALSPLKPGQFSDHLVVGTIWNLRAYASDGSELWTTDAPAECLQVNVQGDWVVATFNDGTIRWYDLRTGDESLALFVHSNQEDWVAWTPDNHYANSPNGKRLIRWHQNQGPSHAAFYSREAPAAAFSPATIRQSLRPDSLMSKK